MKSDVPTAIVRQALAQQAIKTAFAAKALRAARRGGPKGMGTASDLYIRDADGTYAEDAVSLARIRTGRAVRVGKQYFDAQSLRMLLEHKPDAANPYTRQRFPNAVYKKYGRRAGQRGLPVREQVKKAAIEVGEFFAGSRFRIDRGSDRLYTFKEKIAAKYDMSLAFLNSDAATDAVLVLADRGYAASVTATRASRRYQVQILEGQWRTRREFWDAGTAEVVEEFTREVAAAQRPRPRATAQTAAAPRPRATTQTPAPRPRATAARTRSTPRPWR